MPPAPHESKWKFDPTINLGYVLTFAGFMMTIIKGHARYTANFTPPSAPFPTS